MDEITKWFLVDKRDRKTLRKNEINQSSVLPLQRCQEIESFEAVIVRTVRLHGYLPLLPYE